MTLQEFRYEFDLHYNNIASDIAPGLNDKEISYFLTEAQESLVLDMIQGNKIENLENTEIAKEQLSSLITEKILDRVDTPDPKITRDSIIFQLPTDVLQIIYEGVYLSGDCNHILKVLNTTHDSVSKLLDNPFKGPSKQALRLSIKGNRIEVISKLLKEEDKYLIRYIRNPKPIIIGVSTIRGISGPSQCELHESLHMNILSRAVMMAKQSWLN